MTKHDMPLARPVDLAISLGLMTRLPVRLNPTRVKHRGAAAAWAWPLAGSVVGLIAGLIGWTGSWLGLGSGMNAGLVLLSLIMLTGAMHEDGLADSADGLWGGAEPGRRLEIMKDSRIGAYGVIALVLSLVLRWSALSSLISSGWLIAPLIAIGALSRVPMIAMMSAMRNARGTGLSEQVGRPSMETALLASAIAALLGILLLGWDVVPVVFWIALAGYGVASLAMAKINGQTGDTLGATQQVSEITALAVLVSVLG